MAGLTVGRERLADSHEAWLHVDVPAQHDRGGDALLPGLPATKSILTWANSD